MSYDKTKTIKQNIGTTYEYFVVESIKNEYDNVWHWKDFPEEKLYELGIIKDYDIFCKYRNDLGADVVAMKDNIYYFIQCKNFKETVRINDLGGFYFFLIENKLNGILYYNGKISQRLLDLSNNVVKIVNLPFNTEKVYVNKLDLIESGDTFKIRPYQKEAHNILKGSGSALLHSPCGTGKLFISSLLAKDYKNIIILSPLKFLAEQCLHRIHKYLNEKYESILISSDGIRDTNKIKKLLKEKNILSATYDSADVIIKILSSLDNIYIIIDEFHNLSNNNIMNKNDNIYKLISSDNNKLFMSATPISNIKFKNTYKYTWEDSIKNKYICDLKIILPEIDDDLENFKKFIHITNNELDVKMYCKAYFLLKSMLFYANKKCICYLTTVEKSNNFLKYLTTIKGLLNVEINCSQLDYSTAKTKRLEIYENFKKSNLISIILNVHILDEGVDIPECDCVYVTQPNNNIENLVQRMCRANRILPNKQICYIYLWAKPNKATKILEYIFNNTGDFIKEKVFKLEFYGKTHNAKCIKGEIKTNFSNELVKVEDICPKSMKYCCDVCNYKTDKYSNFNRHTLSQAHKRKCYLKDQEEKELNKLKKDLKIENDIKKYFCKKCKKKFKSRNGRWIHEKKCNGLLNDSEYGCGEEKESIKHLCEKDYLKIIKEQKELIEKQLELFKNQEREIKKMSDDKSISTNEKPKKVVKKTTHYE